MRFENFNNCPPNERYYSGNAGNKYGILFEGANWIIKFPKTTRDMHNPQISYTTSPLSEYLGSHIYQLQGIPVHETILGYARPPKSESERLVVACRDFRADTQNISEFKDIKNAQFFNDGDEGTSGNGTILSEVLETIETARAFQDFREAAKARFWDMFLIDFVIGNNDRNNTNWGVIQEYGKNVGLTPVFDNGNAFFNKRSPETFADRLDSAAALEADACTGFRCAYLTDDGHGIYPYELIRSKQYEGCNQALRRFANAYDRSLIQALFDEIPAYQLQLSIMPQIQKQFYLAMIDTRVNTILLPAAN